MNILSNLHTFLQYKVLNHYSVKYEKTEIYPECFNEAKKIIASNPGIGLHDRVNLLTRIIHRAKIELNDEVLKACQSCDLDAIFSAIISTIEDEYDFYKRFF